MSVKKFSLYGPALFLVALLSGCSFMGFGDSKQAGGNYGYIASGNSGNNACQANRNSCLHEGRYEPGEREYAEQAAKNLNQAALARLRRTARM